MCPTKLALTVQKVKLELLWRQEKFPGQPLSSWKRQILEKAVWLKGFIFLFRLNLLWLKQGFTPSVSWSMERVVSRRPQKVLEEHSAWPNLVASHTASFSSVALWGKPVSASLPTCRQTAGSSLRLPAPQHLLQRNEHKKSGEPASYPKSPCVSLEYCSPLSEN